MEKMKFIVTMLILTMLLQGQFGYAEGNNPHFNTGDYFLLGEYNDEPILWRCVEDGDLNKETAELLLYSDKILCFKAFDVSKDTSNVTNSWEKSSLRGWLSSRELLYEPYGEPGFLSNNNFSSNEMGVIKEVELPTFLPRNMLSSEMRNYCFANDYTETGFHGNDSYGMSVVAQIDFMNDGVSEVNSETIFIMDEEQIYRLYLLYKSAAADLQSLSIVENVLEDYNYAYWIRTPYNYKEYSNRDQYDSGENMDEKMHVCTIAGEKSENPSMPIGSTLNQYPYKERGDKYSYANVREPQGVRPAFYLDEENTTVLSGSGSKEDPYVITGNPILRVLFNGEELEFDQRAIEQSGTAYIPVRKIMEQLGAQVSWEEEGRKVIIEAEETTVEVAADMQEIYINGEMGWLPAPVIIKNGRILVPLQVLTAGLGIGAEWDENAETIRITSGK